MHSISEAQSLPTHLPVCAKSPAHFATSAKGF